jgi:hypothetical protein
VDPDTTLLSEFDGIEDKVFHNLPNPKLVTDNLIGQNISNPPIPVLLVDLPTYT